ncbi:YncE family protein [Jeongeupia wiesaeckerbachi]|uniref:WD40 repeat domain-containing protein n=1 Tax=Jeongeupia wiesaeckerbachi TaxID=3051218 RepID=UPI003D800B8D
MPQGLAPESAPKRHTGDFRRPPIKDLSQIGFRKEYQMRRPNLRTFPQPGQTLAWLRSAVLVLMAATAQVAGAGESFYVSTNLGITAYDEESGQITGTVATLPGGFSYDMTVAPDGATLYAVDNSNTLNALATSPLALKPGSLSLPGNHSSRPAFSPDGKTLYIASDAGQILVINAATLSVTQTFATPGVTRRDLAISPDGSRLYALTEEVVKVVSTSNGAILADIALTATQPRALALSDDGARLYSGPGPIDVINTSTNTVSATFSSPLLYWVYGIALTKGGQYLYTGAVDTGSALVVNAATGDIVKQIPVTSGNNTLGTFATSSTGSKVYSFGGAGDDGNTLLTFDTASQTLVDTKPLGAYGLAIATRPAPPAPHTLRFYLHGSDIPGTAGGHTMNQTAPAAGNGPLLLGPQSWLSNPVLTGSFPAGSNFQLSIPCSINLLASYTLAKTDTNGGNASTLGSTSQLLGSCSGGKQTVSIPVTNAANFAGQRLKLTISSLLSLPLNLPIGSNTYLEATGFTGTP